MTYVVRRGDTLSRIARRHATTLAVLLAANPRFRANPDRIVVGDRIDIPDRGSKRAAPPRPRAKPPTRSATAPRATPGRSRRRKTPATPSLGALSAKYETSNRGPGTVSTGQGDAGGVSYGSYQMTSSRGGTVARFVASDDFRWKDEFAGLKPGSAAFTKQWRAIAAAEPEAFHAAQHAYIKRTHYDVLVEKFAERSGLDVDTMPPAVRDVVWSTAVQHGGRTNVLERALRALGGTGPSNPNDREWAAAFIRAIYAERGRRGPDGGLVRFSRNSRKVQASVAKRFVDEQADALRMLADG